MYRSIDIQLSICNTWLYHNHMSVAECRLLQLRFIWVDQFGQKRACVYNPSPVCLKSLWIHWGVTMCIYTPSTRNDELVNESQIAFIQYLEHVCMYSIWFLVHYYSTLECIIMLHVDKFKSHVNLIITHVNMIIFDVWGRNTPPSSTWERERQSFYS